MNTAVNLRIPQKTGKFFTTWTPIVISGRTLFHGAGSVFCLKRISKLIGIYMRSVERTRDGNLMETEEW